MYDIHHPKGSYRVVRKATLKKIVVNANFWGKIASDILYILVPAAISSYFLAKFDDRIVVGVGVGMGIFALYKLATLAYINRNNTR